MRGQSFFYTIDDISDISDLREGESYTIAMINNGGLNITYSDASKTFSIIAPAAGNYTIQGTISDGQSPPNRFRLVF